MTIPDALRSFVAAILLACIGTAVTAAAEPDEPPPFYECERAAKPIDVHGNIRQFDGAPRLYIRDETKVHGRGWAGVDDLSITLRMRFDDNNLYVLVEVMDNDLQWPAQDGEYVWSFDSLQLAFDPKLDGGLSYGPDDSEYLITRIHDKPFVRRRQAPEGKRPGPVDDIPAIVAKHPSVPGWYAIVAFPWNELGVSSPKAGITRMGFDALVNDKDTGRDRIFMEWTPGIGLSKKPSNFGELRLVEKASQLETEAAGMGKSELHPDRWAEKMLDISDSPDADAFGGSAKSLTEPGISCWWVLDHALAPGKYRLFARAKGSGTLSMKLFDHAQDKPIISLPGVKVSSPTYRLYDLGVADYTGNYPLRICDWSTGGLSLDYVAVTSETPLTVASATARSERVTTAAEKLAVLLKQTDAAGIDARDQRITYHTILLFAGYAIDDAKRGKLRRADRVLKYIEAALPRASAELTEKLKTGLPKTTAAVDVTRLSMRDGHFYSGDRPVFLWGALDTPPEWASKLGFNYAYFWSAIERFYASPDQINRASLDEQLGRLRDYRKTGLAVSFLVGLHNFPSAFYRDFPETRHVGPGKSFVIPCLESPKTRELLSLFYKEVPPAMKNNGLLDIELANELGYACRCERSVEMFRKYLKKHYPSNDALSAAWGKPMHMEDAPLPDENTTGAARYDWHDFNQERVVDAFRALSNQVTTAAPGLATDIKIVAGRAFEGGDLTWGIDHERLAQSTVITGQDSYFSESGWPRAMMYDLYRSFACGRCIVDHECAYVRPGATADDVRLNMWISAAHGEAGAALYSWNRSEDTPDVEDTLATQPWSVEAFGRTIRQLNDLAPELVALANVTPQLRILYSRSSSIHNAHDHLPQLARAYEASAFTGAPIGFITERQLAAEIPNGTKLILVPAADYLPADAFDGLVRFAVQGGRIVLVGRCASHTERAAPRADAALQKLDAFSTTQHNPSVPTRQQVLHLLSAAAINVCPDAAPDLEARCANTPSGELRLYINYGRNEQTIDVPNGTIDLVSGLPATHVKVTRYSATLLRLPPAD